ncbi:MAG: O-antigen ligase family protein [Candidatus Bipolaricaulaceae bacterium]
MHTYKRAGITLNQVGCVVIAPLGLLYFFVRSPVIFPFGIYAALLPFDNVLGLETVGTLTRYFGIATVVAFLANRLILGQGRVFKPPSVIWGWLTFLLLASLSSLWALSPESTFRGLFTLIGLFLIYLCAGIYPVEKREVEVLKGLIVLGGCLAAACTLFLYAQRVTYGESIRASLVFGEARKADPNQLATSLVLPLVLSLEWIARPNSLPKKWSFVSTVVILLAILLTGSRGGVLSAAIAMLIFLWRMHKRLSKRSVIAAGLVITTIVAVLALGFLPQNLLERFNLNVVLSSEGAGRFSIWKIGVISFLNKPLLGYGYENFPYAYDLFYSQVPVSYDPGIHRPAHNIYLQIFVETGIIGGFLLLAVFWQHWRLARRLSRKDPASAAVEAILIGVLAAGLTLGNLYWKYFWLAFSLILVVANAERRANADKTFGNTAKGGRCYGIR